MTRRPPSAAASAAVLVALLAALLMAGGGCDDAALSTGEGAGAATAPTGASAASPVSRLFPASPGDRWRLASTPGNGVRLEGVSAIDGRGIIAVHGTAHATAERYRVTNERVALVGPDGETLTPILQTPLRRGAAWRYEHRERDVAVPCDTTVISVDETETVAGAEVRGCVSLRRRCRYPVGAPFTNATTHTSDELYCPGVGLSRVRNVFRPAPTRSTLAADREERVVGFRVEGGAPGGPTEGCARFILLPSDLVTACGVDTRPVAPLEGEEGEDGACRYRYQHGTAALTVVVGSRAAPDVSGLGLSPGGPDEAPTAAAAREPLVHVAAGERAAWMTGPASACPGAARLAPLLTSLLR